MRALILVIVGVIASPAVFTAADPASARPYPADALLAASAPARPAPAPAARAPSPSVRAAPPPSAPRAAPSGQGAPAPRPSGAVRPAPPPHAGAGAVGVRPAPAPGSGRYGPYYGYPHHNHPYYPYYPYSHYPYSYYPYSYYPYYPYWGFGIGVGFGLGWGLGYSSYYPYYPSYPDDPAYGYQGPYAPYPPYAPPQPAASPPPAAAPPAPGATVISFQGGAYSGAGTGAFAIGVDGRRFGFQGSVGGVGADELRGVPVDEEPIVGWGIAHATWSLLATQRFRLRLEGGASVLYMPDSDALAGQPYAGTVAVGPSLGVSGHTRLVGPLGFEGHVRVTPLPVPVADTRAAAVFRAGPIGLAAGWRAIDVSGDPEDGPQLRYSGPELGFSLLF
jgi:hypothetical protein